MWWRTYPYASGWPATGVDPTASRDLFGVDQSWPTSTSAPDTEPQFVRGGFLDGAPIPQRIGGGFLDGALVPPDAADQMTPNSFMQPSPADAFAGPFSGAYAPDSAAFPSDAEFLRGTLLEAQSEAEPAHDVPVDASEKGRQRVLDWLKQNPGIPDDRFPSELDYRKGRLESALEQMTQQSRALQDKIQDEADTQALRDHPEMKKDILDWYDFLARPENRYLREIPGTDELFDNAMRRKYGIPNYRDDADALERYVMEQDRQRALDARRDTEAGEW
jgi:hypothetical protein